jgi:hypothetical protein
LPKTPHNARIMPLRNVLPPVIVALTLCVSGCATGPDRDAPRISPAQARSLIVRLLPPQVKDREGWATDVYAAFAALDLEPSAEGFCATFAVAEQESGFVVDPAVPGLASIAWREIDARAARFGLPRRVVHAALATTSPNGRSYAQRIDAAKTERDLSETYEDLIGVLPLGRRLLADKNPVRTGGPMQVSIAFAEAHARQRPYPYPVAGTLRREVFTRRGGMYFGIAHLLDYEATYDRALYRFADFNAGHYASRNAAFQRALAEVSGIPLALDGDLVRDDRRGRQHRAGRARDRAQARHERLGRSRGSRRRALSRLRAHRPVRTSVRARRPRCRQAEPACGRPRHPARQSEDHAQADDALVRRARAGAVPAVPGARAGRCRPGPGGAVGSPLPVTGR